MHALTNAEQMSVPPLADTVQMSSPTASRSHSKIAGGSGGAVDATVRRRPSSRSRPGAKPDFAQPVR